MKILSCLFLVLISLNTMAQEAEENLLVADTFTKKKHVRYFANYETVAINYLEGGQFQAAVATGVVFQKIGAASTSSSPIAFTLDSTGTKMIAGLAAKYGVTDYFSVGAELTYANGNTSTDTTVSGGTTTTNDKVTGLEDVTLRGQFALPTRYFGYLLEVQWAPTIGKASSNDQTEESNAYHEQSNLKIQNYFILNSGTMKWGAVLSYDYRLLGEVEQISSTGVSTTKEVSGGNTLEAGAFVELQKLSDTYLQLSYVKTESSTRTTSSGVTSDTPALDFISLLAMSEFKFSRKVSLVPQFQYAMLLSKDVNSSFSYTQTDIYGVSATLRFLF